MTRQDDISDSNPLTGPFNLLDETLPDGLADSRMIGNLLYFKNRDGRFVILESLLDYLTNTKRLPGLDCFRIDKARCLFELQNPKPPCDVQWLFGDGERVEWTFGDGEQWRADQCCGILALHKANWTAGKRIPELYTFLRTTSDRINRRLVICLPPEDFVAPHEQTWEAVCEEMPWKDGRNTTSRRLIRSIQDGFKWKILKVSDGRVDGTDESEIDSRTGWPVVRKRVMAPQVAERYVRLSYLGDILPWLREKALPAAEAEDAGLAQTIFQYMDHLARRPAVLADDGRASAREDDIRQKIEIEIAFRKRLVAALEKEGYIVKENGTMTDEGARVALRPKYENEPDRKAMPWAFFFVHPKDAFAGFCLSVWFSRDVPTPSTFKWRPLDGDGLRVAGPSKRTVWDGLSYCDATPPLCYHVSIIDARLRFEALPLHVMRDTLLDGHLAEELASKVAISFECISTALNPPHSPKR